MKKQIEINKISLSLFYAEEKDYKDINTILNAMEKENIILSWSLDNKEYDISYLEHDNIDRRFILDIIKNINENLGFKTVTYKEKATLILK